MERLTGQDAAFLYMETPRVHMHTLKIAILDLPEGADTSGALELLRASVQSQLHLMPRFRRRLVEVPTGLHHPVWVEDAEFDIERHLHRAQILSPGGPREMDMLIGQIASRQLPRDRPLWELWLLEGLADGGLVVMTKIHHSLADGTASVAMLNKIMETSPTGGDPADPKSWAPEAMPSAKTLFSNAIRDQRQQIKTIAPLIKRTAKGGINVLKHAKHRSRDMGRPFRTPRTVFNRLLSSERAFASGTLPLADFKTVKNAAGVTLNDVVLATVGGAMDRFFEARGELPTKPLIVSVPMAVATDTERFDGNRVANLFTSLMNDVTDPLERLRAINRVTKEAKEVQLDLGLETMADWSEVIPAAAHRSFMKGYARLLHRLPAPANLIVSNVRGPDNPLYVSGARLRALYSVGPPVEGVGLNITAWSYCGDLAFALVADAAAVKDPHPIIEALPLALEELKHAVA